MSNFFEDLFNKKKKNTIIGNLYKVPKREKGVNLPHFQQLEPNIIHQADTLYLPNDKSYKYALIVIDTGTSITDADPIKSKDQQEILRAFKKIYSRKILLLPEIMQVDAGTEFKGIVEKYFKEKNIGYRIAKVGRHRAQGKVERRNQIIGKALFQRMASEEALTGKQSNKWVDDLPQLIKAMNKRTIAQNKLLKPLPEKILCEGDTCNLLNIGQKVRVMLEYPIGNIEGERLHGKFRSTDIRWNTEPRTIENIILKPKSPPLYILNKVNKEPLTAYTKQQLQIIDKKEQAPKSEQVLKKKSKTYVVEKIIGKEKINNKIFYRVKWLGYSIADSTLEPRVNLIQDVPDIVKEYENNN